MAGIVHECIYCGREYATVMGIIGHSYGCPSNPANVPATLQVPVPERHEPPCNGDES